MTSTSGKDEKEIALGKDSMVLKKRRKNMNDKGIYRSQILTFDKPKYCGDLINIVDTPLCLVLNVNI